MNDDGLSPREHAEMRDLVLAGTHRIRPASSRRAQFTAAAVALVLVGAVTGGAITTAAILGSETATHHVTLADHHRDPDSDGHSDADRTAGAGGGHPAVRRRVRERADRCGGNRRSGDPDGPLRLPLENRQRGCARRNRLHVAFERVLRRGAGAGVRLSGSGRTVDREGCRDGGLRTRPRGPTPVLGVRNPGRHLAAGPGRGPGEHGVRRHDTRPVRPGRGPVRRPRSPCRRRERRTGGRRWIAPSWRARSTSLRWDTSASRRLRGDQTRIRRPSRTLAGVAFSCGLYFSSGSGEVVDGLSESLQFYAGGAIAFESALAAPNARPIAVDGAVSAVVVPGNDRHEGGFDVLLVSDGTNVVALSTDPLKPPEWSVDLAEAARSP